MKREIDILKSLDWWVILIYLLLVLAGWFNIYAASYDFDNANIFDFSERSGKQGMWILCSLVLIVFVLLLETRFYEDVTSLVYFLMLGLLLLTIFIAPEIKGSRSWLVLGPINVQPAEFAKITTALALSRYISTNKCRLDNWKDLLAVFAIILVPVMLIVGQNETGSALVFFSFVAMFYREGMPKGIALLGFISIVLFIVGVKFSDLEIFAAGDSAGVFYSLLFVFLVVLFISYGYLKERGTFNVVLSLFLGSLFLGYIFSFVRPVKYGILLGASIVIVAIYSGVKSLLRQEKKYLLITGLIIGSFLFSYSVDYLFHNVLKPHQRIRIEVTLGMKEDPRGVGYNVNQSKIAIGSGGFIGKGYLNGTQTKLKYVPEQDTDFIFCTVGEEWGFVGSFIILSLFLMLLLRLLYLCERQKLMFARVYGYCVISIFLFHILINVGMTLGITPVIGIPLPFFSYGGSSLWAFTVLLFIFLRFDASRMEHF